jgi:hypothetical protein
MREEIMAKIITYNSPLTGNPNQCFCQMKFNDGVRILISQTKDGVNITKLLFGIIPYKKIHQADFFEIANQNKFYLPNHSSPLALDHYVEIIKRMENFEDLIEYLKS